MSGALVHGGHGHGHGIGLISALEYGLAANDKGTIEFVRGAYEWAKSNYSSPSIGFFPEWFMPHYDACETDTIADLLGMALKMSAAGVADYWDDADRWTRNHFTESQITSADWINRLAERSPKSPWLGTKRAITWRSGASAPLPAGLPRMTSGWKRPGIRTPSSIAAPGTRQGRCITSGSIS